MNILFIIPWIPYPLDSGGAQAFFNMTNEVRKEYHASLLLYARNPKEKANIEALKRLWSDVEFFVFDAEMCDEDRMLAQQLSGIERFKFRLFEKTLHSMKRKIARVRQRHSTAGEESEIRRRMVLHSTFKELSPSFLNFVQQVTTAHPFDVIQVEFYEYLPLVHLLPKEAKKVFLHHEIRFVHNENELAVLTRPTPYDKMICEQEKGKELHALAAYDSIITLTEVDKELLLSYLPHKEIYVSPCITEICKKESSFTWKQASDLIFVGSGQHMPNYDGLYWFCAEVLPVLKEKGFEGGLYVSGNWDAKARQLIEGLSPAVHFVGFVDDLPSYMNGKVSIVPIRIGGGMRMKIIDAIAAMSPVVSTTKGAEGLPLKVEADYLLADTATSFAEKVMSLIGQHALQQKLAENAQATLRKEMNATDLINKRMNFYNDFYHHSRL